MSWLILYKDIFFQKGIEIMRKEGYLAFLRKLLGYFLSKLCCISGKALIFLFIPQFRRLIKTISEIELAVEFVFSYSFCGVFFKPNQIKEEIIKFMEIMKELKPKIILELGTCRGGTLFLFSVIAESDAVIVTLDLPGKQFGEGYPNYLIPFYRSFAIKNQSIYLVRADSHKVNTLRKIKRILNGSKIDCLFIDGDHSYKGVKNDFEKYSPLVKNDGVIAFHDIVLGPEEAVIGVPKFWNEIKINYRYQEIVKSWEQRGFGIGILFKQKK